MMRSLSRFTIFVRYVVFAAVSGAANLSSQAAVGTLMPSLPVIVSVLFGTGIGFVAKFALDKTWIFEDAYETPVAEARKVIVYGLFSVGTTLLFWSAELGALHAWGTETARYVGGFVGLSVGYWIKYHLDKRYVFPQEAGASA